MAVDAECILSVVDLGQQMDAALPFERSNWFWRVTRAHRFTQKALFPVTVETTDEVYRRVWLERSCTRSPEDSVIGLLADYVVIDSNLDNQKNQFARHGRLIAQHCCGQTSLEAQLPEEVTVRDMIGWVEEVAALERAQQIREAVSLTHLPLRQRMNLDQVPGLQYPVE